MDHSIANRRIEANQKIEARVFVKKKQKASFDWLGLEKSLIPEIMGLIK